MLRRFPQSSANVTVLRSVKSCFVCFHKRWVRDLPLEANESAVESGYPGTKLSPEYPAHSCVS